MANTVNVYVIGANGGYYEQVNSVAFTPTSNDIVELQTSIATQAFDYMYNQVLESAYVMVPTTTIANTVYPFGTDKVTRENIQGTVLAIAANVGLADPILWTPKGYVDAVNVSHQDLITASALILQKVNETYGVYFTHKANIITSDDWTYLSSYDFTTNY